MSPVENIETGGNSFEKDVTKPKSLIDRYFDGDPILPPYLARAMLFAGGVSTLLSACELAALELPPAVVQTVEAPPWAPTSEWAIAGTIPEPSATIAIEPPEEVKDLVTRLGEGVRAVPQPGGSVFSLVFENGGEEAETLGLAEGANVTIFVDGGRVPVDVNTFNKDERGVFWAMGEDGTAYKFVEEIGWQEAETIQIMVNGEMVEGRVIEKSEVWEGEISMENSIDAGLRISGPTEISENIVVYSFVFGFLRQWQRVEFDLPSGGSIEQILADFDYVNSDGERYTVRYRIPAVAGDESKPGSNIVNFSTNPVMGAKYTVRVILIEPHRPTSSQNLVDRYTGTSPFCDSYEACGLLIGGVGDNTLSKADLIGIFSGRAGDFVDLTDKTLVEGIFSG